jgi:hypothetical protein
MGHIGEVLLEGLFGLDDLQPCDVGDDDHTGTRRWMLEDEVHFSGLAGVHDPQPVAYVRH